MLGEMGLCPVFVFKGLIHTYEVKGECSIILQTLFASFPFDDRVVFTYFIVIFIVLKLMKINAIAWLVPIRPYSFQR